MGGRNVSFVNCTFTQLGGIYAVSATQASQQVSVLGSIFTDISGGAVHIGSSGFPHWIDAPDPATPEDDWDSGFHIADVSDSSLPLAPRCLEQPR